MKPGDWVLFVVDNPATTDEQRTGYIMKRHDEYLCPIHEEPQWWVRFPKMTEANPNFHSSMCAPCSLTPISN